MEPPGMEETGLKLAICCSFLFVSFFGGRGLLLRLFQYQQPRRKFIRARVREKSATDIGTNPMGKEDLHFDWNPISLMHNLMLLLLLLLLNRLLMVYF